MEWPRRVMDKNSKGYSENYSPVFMCPRGVHKLKGTLEMCEHVSEQLTSQQSRVVRSYTAINLNDFLDSLLGSSPEQLNKWDEFSFFDNNLHIIFDYQDLVLAIKYRKQLLSQGELYMARQLRLYIRTSGDLRELKCCSAPDILVANDKTKEILVLNPPHKAEIELVKCQIDLLTWRATS